VSSNRNRRNKEIVWYYRESLHKGRKSLPAIHYNKELITRIYRELKKLTSQRINN
jgi:hypothetical protein